MAQPPRMRVCIADALEWMQARPTASVDLVLGSPPYALKGDRYSDGDAQSWDVDPWVEWMTSVTLQAVRIARRQVVWVLNGPTRNGQYHPVVEMLVANCYGAEGVCCERPVIWHKNAPPNRRDWLGNDWEFCVSFFSSSSAAHRVFNWEEIAQPPKYSNGGRFRQRGKGGRRTRGGDYPNNPLARPRDVWRVLVGGGHMGHPLACENEAPYPLELASRFVRLCSNPGDLVLDPFVGSGTTLHAARQHGRRGVGLDCRRSQVALTRRRLRSL